MRHVDPPNPPNDWQTLVFDKGCAWLNESTENRNAKRPYPHWRAVRDQIGEAFNSICCYTVVYVPNGVTDHFVPWSKVSGTADAFLAYQWSNIRYADGWINSSKGDQPFPDPFAVEDNWFELQLPSLELHATGKHPPEQQQAIDNLLKRVRNDERVMKVRRLYFAQYKTRERSLKLVDREMPLLGRALRNNPSFLLPEDQVRLQEGTL